MINIESLFFVVSGVFIAVGVGLIVYSAWFVK